ncbi:alpha/beta fold hydrolase [Mycobacteroides salmoniphilum]|uniref:alpha/beta fold hydrolase n=1 Tax=Mycobacteroides salmoniphilum TaxID=404941 RepID=UPI0009933E64|nr:alpha/beta hydrolase [Mycobacteroides salmoniphilum]QCH26127.1 Haloalkane dehalogenase [Mycobacteroides salmoniphilum]
MAADSILTLDLPNVRLRALSWGPQDSPLLICGHGFPDSAHTWRLLGPRLAADGWRVVAPFTRGYSPSEIPADAEYGLGALMQDILDIHTVLGGDERAVYIGHDWGALVGNALARSALSPFASIITMAVPPFEVLGSSFASIGPTGWPRVLGRQLLMSWYTLFHQIPVLPELLLPWLLRLYWRRWSPGYDAHADLLYTGDAMLQKGNRRAVIGYYRANIGRALVPSRKYWKTQRSLLDGARTPLLYLHGRADGCMTQRLVESARPDLPDRSVEIIDGGGHFVHLECPDEVYELVREFLRPPTTKVE